MEGKKILVAVAAIIPVKLLENQQVCTEIELLTMPFRSVQENLNKNQKKALTSLQRNKNIIIKQADKGGNIVILDKSQYVNTCEKVLDNSEWYERVRPESLDLAH